MKQSAILGIFILVGCVVLGWFAFMHPQKNTTDTGVDTEVDGTIVPPPPPPTTGVNEQPIDTDRPVSYTPDSARNLITITSPAPNAIISSPLVIEGSARGNWLFEATAPVSLVNWDGLIIAEGYIEAQGEWMTENFVPITGTLNFTVPQQVPSLRGALILHKANASGLPEHDAAMEIPVWFAQP